MLCLLMGRAPLGAAICWTLHHLAFHPDLLDQVCDRTHSLFFLLLRHMVHALNGPCLANLQVLCEVDALQCPHAAPETYLTKLPVLRSCLLESVRLHPPVPDLYTRVAGGDVNLLDVRLPDKVSVLKLYFSREWWTSWHLGVAHPPSSLLRGTGGRFWYSCPLTA